MFSVSSLFWLLLGPGPCPVHAPRPSALCITRLVPVSCFGSVFLRPFLCVISPAGTSHGSVFLPDPSVWVCCSESRGFCPLVVFGGFYPRRVRRYLSGLCACARKTWFFPCARVYLITTFLILASYGQGYPCGKCPRMSLRRIGARIDKD